jgi:KDO2-lipid IV(A) lauroyltransferase
LWLLGHLPEGFARCCSRLLDIGLPRLRHTAMNNLAFAYPEKTDEDCKRIVDGVFRSIARLLYAFARFPQITSSNVSNWIRYEGLEHYLEAKKQGKGVMVATAHLGNWELSAFAHALMTEPMNIVIRRLDHSGVDQLVESRRQLSGNRLIEKHEAARTILRVLARNEAVGVLIDQNTSLQEGVFVNFFGKQASASAAFVRFAARTGAATIPGFALWSETERRYVLRFYPPVPMTGDVQGDAQRLHSVLEAVIREYPDQWLWIHRRWKTQPAGDDSKSR